MTSPSALLKVNYLVMRYLYFGSVRGDLQEGHFYASRCHLSLCSSTKMPFLCSKSPKTMVLKGKSAQKPRFCARKARKRGLRTPKAHKNPDFVLEMPENGGSEGKKSTKTHFLCSGGRDWHREGRKLVSESITADTFIVNVAFLQITAHTSKTQMSHNQIINF